MPAKIDLQKIFTPKAIIVLTIICATWVNFNITFWQSKKVIDHDVSFYYSYLPSAFYYNDLSLNFLNDTVNSAIETRYFAPPKAPNGNYVIKSTYGMSLTYLPFFAAAHCYAKVFNYETNGYSEPYHFAIQFSSLFYFIFGLFFLVKILRFYFPESVITLTILFITFATNALYYITVGAGMSHAVNFGLIAAFVYYSIVWHKDPSFKNTTVVGLLGAVITLIRPINILVFLFFFLFDIKTFKDVGPKIKLLLRHKFKILLMAILGVAVFTPQLIYWKHQTGHYFFNSYVSEHFLFGNPHVFYGLFSFRKGWLVYTPIMLFSLIGFYSLLKQRREFFYPLVLLFIIYIYVTFSWWCWWYGGSFGQRPMIDIYPLLALPFAALLYDLNKKTKALKIFVYVIMTLLLLLNIFQSMQAKWNTVHFDSMTKEAYFDAFLRLTKNPEREKFLKHPDDKKAKAGLEEY